MPRVPYARLHRAVQPLGIALLVCAVLGGAERAAGEAVGKQPIPLLAPLPFRSIERDMPASVRARMTREQRAWLARAKAASKLPRTRAAGCEPAQIGAQRHLGPPAPQVTGRIIGHHVEIVFSFRNLPASDACRPLTLSTVVNGVRITTPGPGAIYRYQIRGPRARVVSDLPWYAKPPYRLLVTSETLLGLRSRYVEVPLRCPGTGHFARGCLRGYAPSLHRMPIPKPVLPLRGVDRTGLEATLRYVVADERAATPTAARCATLSSCELTYVDPDFPKSPYRVRYRIAGQQLHGCWMAWRGATVDKPPYEDAWQGRLQLAGCVAWLR